MSENPILYLKETREPSSAASLQHRARCVISALRSLSAGLPHVDQEGGEGRAQLCAMRDCVSLTAPERAVGPRRIAPGPCLGQKTLGRRVLLVGAQVVFGIHGGGWQERHEQVVVWPPSCPRANVTIKHGQPTAIDGSPRCETHEARHV